MTTIAYDGHTLAADRLSSWHRSPVAKLHRLSDGSIIGGSGRHEHVLRATEWLENGASVDSKPRFSDSESFDLLRVYPNGSVVSYEDGLHAIPVTLPFIATGSGGRYAMGAMACGKSAREAVEIAARFDLNTGVGVDEMRPGLISKEAA